MRIHNSLAKKKARRGVRSTRLEATSMPISAFFELPAGKSPFRRRAQYTGASLRGQPVTPRGIRREGGFAIWKPRWSITTTVGRQLRLSVHIRQSRLMR